MKCSLPSYNLLGLAAASLMALAIGNNANATTFEFELNVEGNTPSNNNDVDEFPGPNPQVAASFYGSNIAAETAAFITSDGTGTTPNIAIKWGPDHDVRPDVWEFHNGAFWDVLWDDINTPEFVAQIDVDGTPTVGGQPNFPDDPTIEFIPDPGYAVDIHGFELGISNTSTRAPYNWIIQVRRSSDDAVVDSYTTGDIPVGGSEYVDIDYLGDVGVSYYLHFDDEGEDHTSTAMDRLSFSQVPRVPEPASLALLALGSLALGWRRR